MSIDISRTINLFQQSELVLHAKSTLLNSMNLSAYNPYSSSNTKKKKIFRSSPYQSPTTQQQQEPNPSSQLSLIIQQLTEYWTESLNQKQPNSYSQSYSKQSNKIHKKIQELKNNTTLLTKTQQLLSQIQQQIQKYTQIDDPVLYYDINYRKNMKDAIEIKLKNIQQSAEQTKQSMKPMYSHKIQKQSKDIIYEAYQNQVEIDMAVNQSVYETYGTLLYKKVKEVQYKVAKNRVIGRFYVGEVVREFYEENSAVFERMGQYGMEVAKYGRDRKRKDSMQEKCLDKYLIGLNIKIRCIYQYWTGFRIATQKTLQLITNNILNLQQSQKNFTQKQSEIMSNLENISIDIARIFQVQTIFNNLKKFHKNFQQIKILNKLQKNLQKYQTHIQKMQRNAYDYTKSITKNITRRTKDFKNYLLVDKNFMDQHIKSQKYLVYSFMQDIKEILHEMCRIIKEIVNMANGEKRVYRLEEYQVSKIVNKCIIQQGSIVHDENNKNISIGSRRNQVKNQKIKKIMKFLDSVIIYDINKKQGNQKQFSAALGPKLLLHGKILINNDGIFYQSLFNKKNLFFGKTKLFIHRDDISQIDQKNTLYIFPDAIQIKTIKGSIFFHALGARKQIADVLTAEYFPQNNPGDTSCVSDGDFCDYTPDSTVDSKSYEKMLEPYQDVCVEHVFYGCKMNKFFRRYFSDDQFEIRGKMYDNFKVYFLEQIQAIQPKGTQLTPEPPAYFMYKNQQIPQTNSQFSQRLYTYRKLLPKIPFISKGGEGLCQQRQKYYWCNPQLIIIQSISVVKGFSLTQGMQILIKNILKQQGNNIKHYFSACVTFATQSSSNSLVRTPTLSNLKSSIIKMNEIIQKYQKGKKSKKQTNKNPQNVSEQNNLQNRIQTLTKQNKKLQLNIKIMAGIFLLVYFCTFFVMWLV